MEPANTNCGKKMGKKLKLHTRLTKSSVRVGAVVDGGLSDVKLPFLFLFLPLDILTATK